MEPNFEHATGDQKYFAALIAAFKRLFHRRSQLNCAKGIIVPPMTEFPTSLHCQSLYQDQPDRDPPTPHWGC
jgi:hypothetical protein